jgi:hypothetical protein
MADETVKITEARLRRGVTRLGWTPWWLVDANGNLLNTEPVCTTPEDKWHPWFIKVLEGVTTPYFGLESSPDTDAALSTREGKRE